MNILSYVKNLGLRNTETSPITADHACFVLQMLKTMRANSLLV